jgi:prolipoprotein diacylglyceryl transferase
VAIWAVPFGLVGGRIYHVITDPELYFASGKDPWGALYVWRGGLGIWGAIALGALGAYIGCRRQGASFRPFADAMAPGIALAQAIGRWGNWFNQELYGKPTDLPWGLEIDPAHRTPGYEKYSTFQPTFLYESIWDVGTALLVIWADKRFKLGWGRAFALYVMAYTAGRGWIEYMRIDTVNHIIGLRLNVWTSIILFILASIYFVVVGRRHPGREEVVQIGMADESTVAAADESDGDVDDHAGDAAEDEAVGEADSADDDTGDDAEVRPT